MPKSTLTPISPGEILLEEFLRPHEIAPRDLADALGIPNRRVHDILSGRREITVDTALRLARYFGTSTEMWVNLQHAYALQVARSMDTRAIDATVTPLRTRRRTRRGRSGPS